MKPSEALRAAREKIAEPKRWTKGKFAKGALGETVKFDSPVATCWCLVGAVSCFTDGNYLETREFIAKVTGTGGKSLSAWNDAPKRMHAEVLAALTKAAELAESEGQ